MSRFAPILLLACVVAVSGCERQPDLMPLAVGEQITYSVTAGLDKHVEPVRVVREIPVGGNRGFELSGPLGSSRVAWRNGELIASQTVNARFDPPLPLLATDRKNRFWNGTVSSLGRQAKGRATLTHARETKEAGGKKRETVKATLTLELPRGKIELISWYEPKVGLVWQEQRTGEEMVLRLEILGGGNLRGGS